MNLLNLVKSLSIVEKIQLESLDALHNSLILSSVHLDFQYQSDIAKLTAIADLVQEQMVFANQTLDDLKNKILLQIDEASAPYCIKDNIIDGVCIAEMLDVKGNRSRTLTLSDESSVHLISKIRENTSTRYPALEIGPGDGQWTKALVAADPLYLVDVYEEFLNSAALQFPIDYQRRLRKYQVYTHDIGYTDLSQLPQNQMGFVFSCNVFEYFTMDVFNEYLKSIFNVLRPGGKAILTYNNSEYESNVLYVELGVRSWMPKSKLIALCTAIGYEVLETVDYPSFIHWIEIKKPGILSTVKRIQGLGNIVDKNSP